MRRFRWIVFLAALLLTASAVAGVVEPRLVRAADTPPGRTITVVGNGTAKAVPDRASFTFEVDTQATDAKAALAKNATLATAVIAALKNAGVASTDLQTSGVWLSPQRDSSGTAVTGFTASNSVSATTDIAKAGPLVDAAVAAGATGVSGPNLLVSDEDALYREALKDAVADAAQKAAAIAAASGLTLGSVQTISEGTQGPVYPYGGIASTAGATSAGAVATPIEPGQQSSTAMVTVTYDAS
jgi:uncharacterized protein YggE